MVDEEDLIDAKMSLISNSSVLSKEFFNDNELICRYPRLKIDNPEIWEHLKPVKKSSPECEKESNWVYVKNG